jgi:hypothetical protein
MSAWDRSGARALADLRYAFVHKRRRADSTRAVASLRQPRAGALVTMLRIALIDSRTEKPP